MVYPAMNARYATADASPANTLPDLGKPDRRNATLSPGPTGLTLESTSASQKYRLAPEYSNLTGLALNAGFAAYLNDNTALGLLLTAGADKKELLLNAGYQLDGSNRLLFTLGQLRQNLEFAFLSGNDKTQLTQNSGALSYQHRLGRGPLGGIELNAYHSNTASRDLGSKTYGTDSATLYELWNEPRRIAGGKITGLQSQLTFTPLPGAALKLGLGGERLEYDFASGKDSTTRATGNAEWNQQFANGYSLNAALGSFAAQERHTLGLDRKLGGGHQIGVKLIEIHGRDGSRNDSQVLLAYTYTQGGRITQPAASQNPAWNGSLLDQAARRPTYLPMQAIARRDTTTTPQRLVAIDKTALPTGASIDKASGSITTPLPAAATGIVSITKNGAAFANSGQFALVDNSLIINPGLITQPAIGIVDTYVLTLNNADGSTTLATVLVSHGSVQIDGITLVTIAADTTPDAFVFVSQSGVAFNTPTESNAIVVSGINAATPISISGGEYSIDGGPWTSAPGTVVNGQSVRVRHTTAAGNNGQTATVLIIGGVSSRFTSTTQAAAVVTPPAPPAPVDHASSVTAPTGTATATTVTETNTIADADGLRNITYFLYQNDGTTLVSSNGTGAFIGLTASTPYKMKTSAETYNAVSGVWALQTSPLAAITTAAAADTTPPPTPATLVLTGNAGASAGHTDTTNISLSVANVADPSGVMWFVSESSSAPAAGDAGWSSTQPTSYTLSAGDGSKSVYVYVRDNAATPNVQPTGKTTSIVLDTSAPTAPAGNEAMTPGETRSISVTFNEAIQSTAAITVNSGTLNSYAVAGNVLSINYTASGTGGTYNNALSVVAKNLAGDPSAAVGVNVVVNSAPTANNFTYGTNVGNTAKTFDWFVLSSAADADGDTLTASVTTPASKGTCSIVGNNLTYTPNAGQSGSDSCGLTISDGHGGTKLITVTVQNVFTAVPTGLTWTGSVLSWNPVAGAASYTVVNVTGSLQQCSGTATTSCDLVGAGTGDTISVTAIDAFGVQNTAPTVLYP